MSGEKSRERGGKRGKERGKKRGENRRGRKGIRGDKRWGRMEWEKEGGEKGGVETRDGEVEKGNEKGKN